MLMIKKNQNGFTLLELMIVVALMAILATIAIPAFIRYMQRAKTSEAKSNIQKIYSGSVVYFDTQHVKRTFGADAILTHRFPCDTSPTGSQWCPLYPPRGKKTSQPKDCWTNTNPDEGEIWKAIYFSIADHNYFSYRYVCTDSLGRQAFLGQARGDLDGDGVNFSLFERGGYADPSTSQGVGASGVYEYDPLE